MAVKESQSQMEFWADYGKQYGEKVLAYVLGKYLSGWPDYRYSLHGILIATSGGFRFQHFPQERRLLSQPRAIPEDEIPREKTIFIPRNQILSADIRLEKSWVKKIFAYCPPILVIRYRHSDPRNPEQESAGLLLAEAYQPARVLISALAGSAGKEATG
ncbi:MAG: hypothetical protein LBK05_01385 [Treponema sp.]|nr:hypothetical protein [Treponema sp.]